MLVSMKLARTCVISRANCKKGKNESQMLIEIPKDLLAKDSSSKVTVISDDSDEVQSVF